MLLTVEIGNSKISFGLFDDDRMVYNFQVATDLKKTSDEYVVTINSILLYHGTDCAYIDAAVICSVVPQLTEVITAAVRQLSGVQAMIVGKGIKTGFPIKIDNPADLGADLVANAAAVIDIRNKENKKDVPCIIIDMGTATTIFAINAKGEYVGGSILPGVGISLDALRGKTAQLPTVTPLVPTRAIGKNSQESVRSGVILGNAIMIDGFIRRFEQEMKCHSNAEVFVTGEYAQDVISACEHIMRYIPMLTLMGLYCIYKNNIKA
jgi:type III pantothenate kinase